MRFLVDAYIVVTSIYIGWSLCDKSYFTSKKDRH